MGELSRQTEYKDKSIKRGSEGQLVALFTYPVLMAADILLYNATHIPVGEDQKQHVELARDIADRFNNQFGQTFVVPEPVIREVGARVMSLQDPLIKMSKSDPNQAGNILLLDDPDEIKSKFKRAVTDSGDKIEASDDKPALTNLLQIYAGFSGQSVEQIEQKYSSKGYGEFKTDLGELVAGEIATIQSKFNDLMKDRQKLQAIIDEGANKAREIAQPKLADVKAKIGLL
jgi:tryptophanyl-tRNA synthetase